MNTAAEIVAECRHVLVDFDGPVCAVFGAMSDRAVAAALRKLLPSDLPEVVTRSHDPFDVFRYAASLGDDLGAEVEAEFHRREYEAVAEAPPTDGAFDVIRALSAARHVLTVVSNNSKEAVRRFLGMHELADQVHGISARSDANPKHLKPSPYLLHQAMQQQGTTPEQCVMIGDSASDIKAAHVAGVRSIAYVNKPRKRERLSAQHPDAIIDRMAELCP